MDEWLMLALGIVLVLVGFQTKQQKQDENNFISIAMIVIGILLALANFFDILT